MSETEIYQKIYQKIYFFAIDYQNYEFGNMPRIEPTKKSAYEDISQKISKLEHQIDEQRQNTTIFEKNLAAIERQLSIISSSVLYPKEPQSKIEEGTVDTVSDFLVPK